MSLRKTTSPEQSLYKLSKEEVDDPTIVFDKLFDMAHLPQVRAILWDWLKSTVTGSYPKNLTNRERTEIILLYEHVEKMIEAAHIISERNRQRKNKR